MLPSAKLPFVNVQTDGKAKNRHNKEILFLSHLLQKAGVKRLCLHHVTDAGMDKSLPLTYQGKWYDVAYVSSDGEVFMIEIMRTRLQCPEEEAGGEQPRQKGS